ncbi:MAG: ATP-binding protein [Candidatus Dormibacteraeota bacterium]|nr:ATP-binding protein [Candidatus Dormibacteraeota bacterium]
MREQLRRTRVRLTLVDLGAFALVAVLAAVGFWLAFRTVEYQAVDSGLVAQSHLVEAQILENSGQQTADGGEPLPGETDTGIAVGALLLSSEGKVLGRSGPIHDPPGLAAAGARPANSGAGCCQTTVLAGQSIRILAVPVDLPGGGRGTLVLGRPVDELQETLLRVGFLLAAVVAILVAGAGALGYWLAGRALRPVGVMAATARQISEQDLNRRIGLDLPPGDELGELAATFNSMLARLEASFQGLRRFTADAAHEFRAPLALMRTQVDVTLRRPRSAAEYEASQRALLPEIERLSRLSDQLLLLARADAGALAPRHEVIDVPEFLEDTVERWRPVARERRVEILSQLPLEGSLTADADLMRRLLDNLVDNAIRHTPPGGSVSVTATEKPGWWELAVRDTGPGVDPAFRPRLFERFARADEARSSSTGGAGLGLSLCAAIVHAHGGAISLEDSGLPGANFVVRLPGPASKEGSGRTGVASVSSDLRGPALVEGRPRAPGGAPT